MYPLIIFGIPSLLGVFLFEFLSAQMYFSPIEEPPYFFEILRVAHVIPAFLFAYISDKNYRKGALLTSHLLGLATVSLLYFVGSNFWTLLLIAIVFNPISVARAALLDNFPRYSPLKLMAIVFIVKFIPWILFGSLFSEGFHKDHLLLLTIFLFILNVLLIGFFFKDKKDIFAHSHQTRTLDLFWGIEKKVAYLVFAFILAQIPGRMAWGRVHLEDFHIWSWIALTNIGLALGTASAMLYKKLPHLSIVTLTYVAGVCTMILALLEQSFGAFQFKQSFSTIMSYYGIVGGIALPLFADAVITMFGAKKKALGAAMIDLSEALALTLSAFFVHFSSSSIHVCLILFLGASLLQKHIERKSQHFLEHHKR